MQSRPYIFEQSNGEIVGIAANLVKVIFNVLNISLKILPPDQKYLRELLVDGSSNAILNDFNGFRTVAVIGPTAFLQGKLHLFDMTNYLYQDDMVWVFPTAHTISEWQLYIFVFSDYFWLLLFISLIVITILWLVIARIMKHETYYWKQPFYCFLNLFAINLGLNVNVPPKTWTLRIILLIWLYYGLHISVAYQSKLSSFLTTPVYEKQISTLSELNNSDTIISLPKRFLEIYVSNDSHLRNIKINSQPDIRQDILRIVHNEHIAIISNYNLLLEMSKRTIDLKTDRQMIFIPPFMMQTIFMTLYVQKGHPLYSLINTKVLEIHACGLSTKWTNDFNWLRYKNTKRIGDEKRLSIEMLQAPLFALGFGYIISVFVFIIELCLSWK